MSVDTTKVPVAHIKGICASFGFEAEKVTGIWITPDAVTVEWFEDRVTKTQRIPIVGP